MRKKSFKLAASTFRSNTDEILDFTQRAEATLGDQDTSWCYDLAIIRLYREFEDLMLTCLIALVNSDSTTFSNHKSRSFPQHMNVEVCEYLICGDGYFDFAGRPGLIKKIKQIVPDGHWFHTIVADAAYTRSLNYLSSLRNFAAHDSAVSKKKALEAINQERMASSGAWLKKQNRLAAICNDLKAMSQQIENTAPY